MFCRCSGTQSEGLRLGLMNRFLFSQWSDSTSRHICLMTFPVWFKVFGQEVVDTLDKERWTGSCQEGQRVQRRVIDV